MFVEAIEEILVDHCTPSVIRRIEGGAPATELWNTVADLGFLELLTSEDEGGAGLSLSDVFPVIVCLGRYAVPVPIAQSVFARLLLGSSQVEVPDGMITFSPSCTFDDSNGTQCVLTPYGVVADYVLADRDGDLVFLSCEGVTRIPAGVRGSLTASLHWEKGVKPTVTVAGAARALHHCAAVAHAALLAGAMSRVFSMSLQYANDRVQFGKAIGKFQAIQHQLAIMAQLVSTSNIAAELGFSTKEPFPALLPAAVAKARTSEAAPVVAAAAHALHGAIGVTEEFDLQLYTRRLHEWRMAHGSENYWNGLVGDALLGSEEKAGDFVRKAF